MRQGTGLPGMHGDGLLGTAMPGDRRLQLSAIGRSRPSTRRLVEDDALLPSLTCTGVGHGHFGIAYVMGDERLTGWSDASRERCGATA
jgi:hypothetical protein